MMIYITEKITNLFPGQFLLNHHLVMQSGEFRLTFASYPSDDQIESCTDSSQSACTPMGTLTLGRWVQTRR